MPVLNTYLNFNGNCREAFDFYKKVFGKEFSMYMTYGEMPPPEEGEPSFPEKDKDLVMHVSLPISEETVLMGSDSSEAFGPPVTMGNNFTISIGVDSQEEADRFFNELSIDGKVDMPMADMFWGSYFGSFTDQFGINWMVDFQQEE